MSVRSVSRLHKVDAGYFSRRTSLRGGSVRVGEEEGDWGGGKGTCLFLTSTARIFNLAIIGPF